MMVRERRKNFRVQWNSPATIELDNGRSRACIVSDLSNGGAKISGVKAATIPDEFMLHVFSGARPPRRCRVIWRSANELGVEFADRRTNADNKARREMAAV
jgi:hypothetical protein